MKKREDIIQKFSTFLSFSDYNSYRNPIWQADSQLERRIKFLTELAPEFREEAWARLFLKIIKKPPQSQSSNISQNEDNWETREENELFSNLRFSESSIDISHLSLQLTTFSTAYQTLQSNLSSSLSPVTAERHLSAYLQEACLWAAQKRYQKFKFIRYKYSIEEYFQMANAAVCQPAKLLKSFDFFHPRTNLEGYARTALLRFISNTIYNQDLEAKREKFSNYGLLKDLNAKELKEALLSQGMNNHKVELYCLAWKCFDEICKPNQKSGNLSMEPPNRQSLQQISDRYNQQLSQLGFLSESASEEKIQEILTLCIRAARDYRTKRFIPLENYDNISDCVLTPWDIAMQKEELEEIQVIVSRILTDIPEMGQVLLKMWWGLNLTQTEIATVLKNKYPQLQRQYQVARQLGKDIKNLLKEFILEWNIINPEESISNEKDIERLKEALNECLQIQIKKKVTFILDKVAQQCWIENKEIQDNHIAFIIPEKNVSHLPRQDLSEMYNILSKSKKDLIRAFSHELAFSMGLSTISVNLVQKRITDFVEEWLKDINCRLK
ncbi:MAG: sigma-70 family RNA polymerase sigma factor [Scytonema sp. PMC 1070.18]|nr:sigma-70 family RNA polymerase sigma factor [Scytonema sp. PMC 1070.18]